MYNHDLLVQAIKNNHTLEENIKEQQKLILDITYTLLAPDISDSLKIETLRRTLNV